MLYVARLTQNQNNPRNSILQYGCDVGKDCCVVFSASGFSYLILCPRQCKEKVATTYLKSIAIKVFSLHKSFPILWGKNHFQNVILNF